LIVIGVLAILFNGSLLFVLLTSGAPQTWTSSQPRPVTVASGAFPSAESRPAPVAGVAAATVQAGAVSSAQRKASPETGAALNLGGIAQVRGSSTAPVRVWSEPGQAGGTVAFLPAGARVRLAEGPKVMDGRLWWSIFPEGEPLARGWVTEESLAPVVDGSVGSGMSELPER